MTSLQPVAIFPPCLQSKNRLVGPKTILGFVDLDPISEVNGHFRNGFFFPFNEDISGTHGGFHQTTCIDISL